ncbi:hypothetical protein D0Z08_26060 [Nocardioides immobilis]|uniref:Uncharacterized protein n=1 Tax=Nocardioides immobilis TaxID=2049295 RepID=A0A417XV16_9ACTN|nr:hypothetical protein [Nocardioides immobilis]RHW24186.1 hypothetical protein D0Z08_26060 [Nocardioides immobilis]
MSWMFPDSTADGCDAVDPGGRRTREIWCRDVEVAGRTVDLHFSDWKGPRDVDSHYAGDRIGPLPDPFVEARAFEVRSARGAKGVLRYFGYRVDDWSVSVYAESREDLIAAIAGLQIRPGADWRATQRQE